MKVGFDLQTFYGASVTSVFGNVRLDLRNAVIEDDAVIRLCVVFGNVEILLPEHLKVSVSVSQIFSGISNTHAERKGDSDPTLHLCGSCTFGGGTIK